MPQTNMRQVPSLMLRMHELKNKVATLRSLILTLKNRQVPLNPFHHDLNLKAKHLASLQINPILTTELNFTQLAEIKGAALPVYLEPPQHSEIPNLIRNQ